MRARGVVSTQRFEGGEGDVQRRLFLLEAEISSSGVGGVVVVLLDANLVYARARLVSSCAKDVNL